MEAERPLGQPIDRMFGVYALVAAAALIFPFRPPNWPILAALHVTGALIGFGWMPAAKAWTALGQRWPRATTLLHDWYPLFLVPLLYAELAVLNRAVHAGQYFDPMVLAAEEALFGGQPSRAWAAAAPIRALSELLHASYLSYYLIIYVPPLILYLKGRRDEFRQVVLAIMLTFFLHYVFFIYLPVQGPRYLFEAPGGVIESGFFYQLAHRVLEAGSSQGAAFPSSHVGVSFAQTLLTRRYLPRLAIPAGLLTLGLGIGAVYGGFHYLTDVLLGAVLGFIAINAAPRVQAALTSQAAPAPWPAS